VIRDHRKTGSVESLYREHFERPTRSAESNGHIPTSELASERSDAEVIEKVRAEQGGKFDRLWNGDTSDYGYDHSNADDGFVHKLWPYTQDEEQIRRIHAASGLHRTDKSGRRYEYLQYSIERARENIGWFYEWESPTLSLNGNGTPSSQRPVPIGVGTVGRKLEVVRLGEVEQPGPRRYVVEDLIPAGYPTLWHGDGGVAKSMLALSLGVSVAGEAKTWLGRVVEPAPVLYLDFELEAEEQARRVWQLCRGAGLKAPPTDLLYVSAVGHATRDALQAALRTCEEHAAALLVVDSLGPALQGDAEAARDVIGFYRASMDPFRALGVAVLIIDHQARLQAGESYQRKGAFGSVYKANLARSVIQAEATERAEGALSLRIRQKKHNFGPLVDPFGVKLSFSEESVSVEVLELEATDLAEEATLTAPERIKLALQEGPRYPSEIAETTGMPTKTVKNSLTGLRKHRVVESTGEKVGREEQVRIIVPASLSLKRDGAQDDSARPLSWDAPVGVSELPELKERREAEAHEGPATRTEDVRSMLSRPPSWLQDQMAHCRRQGCPAGQLKALAASAASALYGDVTKGAQILPTVEAFMTHGIDCECEVCL
jgi:AAA domain